MLENSVLPAALESLLMELGVTVNEQNNVAAITYGPRYLKLEKRGNYWYDSEKSLWFYSQAQIATYMTRPTLRTL